MVAIEISSDSGDPLVSCEAVSLAMKGAGGRVTDGLDNNGLGSGLGDGSEVRRLRGALVGVGLILRVGLAVAEGVAGGL